MRYLQPYIEKDLQTKMVLLGGPRQCGKTTLALAILGNAPSGRYFNWDADEDRRAVLAKAWSGDDRLIVLDELHKYLKWKNWLKGTFDTQRQSHNFLVTGSARLDVFRRGGDSLLGRYHYWRLHPFSLCEHPASMAKEDVFHRLMTVGGFPEPFLQNDEREARRWRRDRLDRVVKDDLRDLESIRDISKLTIFVDALRERVGSPIVLGNLARDLEVAPKTLKHWLDLLERMYLVFVVRPYAGKLSRTLVKPPKVYFFDNGDVLGDDGARFENLVATHLLKRLNFLEDRDGYRYELGYIRDKEKHEVDFVILKDAKVQQLIEAKWRDAEISGSLRYFSKKLKPKRSVQIVGQLARNFDRDGIEVKSATSELSDFSYV